SKGCKRKTSKIPKKKPVNLLTDWHYTLLGFFNVIFSINTLFFFADLALNKIDIFKDQTNLLCKILDLH
ncbi:hypothetical protein, partial [Acinetobacter indicus]|uniref:hypothetical protein n=1 Tax=Acinetobacter indicus TaxID=756892 RepID=UPI0025765155